jgi:hypothetical protein
MVSAHGEFARCGATKTEPRRRYPVLSSVVFVEMIALATA